MNKKHDLLGIVLAAVTGVFLLTSIILKTFLPRIILPKLNAPAVVVISLVTLLIDYYFAKQSRRNFILIPIYAALIFGIFPYTAAFTTPLESLKLAAMGVVIFTLVTFLFDTMTDRLSTGPATKIAPAISAFCLYLATSCIMGII